MKLFHFSLVFYIKTNKKSVYETFCSNINLVSRIFMSVSIGIKSG